MSHWSTDYGEFNRRNPLLTDGEGGFRCEGQDSNEVWFESAGSGFSTARTKCAPAESRCSS